MSDVLGPSDFAYDDEQRHGNDHGPEPEPEPEPPTLHERISAAVAEKRADVQLCRSQLSDRGNRWAKIILAACDHADKVLARHRTKEGWGCHYDGRPWPCPEVRDLADLWLGPGWEDQ